jgi:hypothetical protein
MQQPTATSVFQQFIAPQARFRFENGSAKVGSILCNSGEMVSLFSIFLTY